MNPEWKAKWIEALRSGEYTQGFGYLETDDGSYCCLGVLCKVMRPHDADIYELLTGMATRLTPDLLHDAALDEDTQSFLIKMNDRGSTFNEIADWIEAKL